MHLRRRGSRRTAAFACAPWPSGGLNSVFADFFVDAVGPGVDTPAQVDYPLKAMPLQELDSLHSARSHFADCNDLLAGVQLLVAPGELGQGNQVPSNV